MNDQTRQFLTSRFREYYAERRVSVPPRLVSREWGFIFFDETPGVAMRRHKAFNSESELNDYLASIPPAHAYHSAAYYQYPQAPTMLEKKWQGADLIFDLDADHLPGVEKMSYAEMLDNVKREIIRLIDDFLLDDLGFSERDLQIVFSGGRGYHVHVRDERVKALKSPERREIVDYLLGTGLDIDHVFERSNDIVEGQKGKRTTGVWRIRGFGSGSGYGWNRRAASYIADQLGLIGSMQEKEAKEWLKKYGLEANRDRRRKLADPETADKVRNQGLIEISGDLHGFFRSMLEGTIEKFHVDVAGKTDEPVTADIKRLIRLPGSIHGKSSFRVTPLTRPQLETFNPLEDAIIFGDSPVRVLVTKPKETVQVRGKVYTVTEGVGRLPECVAVHLMCRGSAEYAP
jgi:DNA primase small subunit